MLVQHNSEIDDRLARLPGVFMGTPASWATFSSLDSAENRATYRWAVGRRWDPALPYLVGAFLNPSTADHEELDPTLKRFNDFTLRFGGYGGWIGLNAYAWRATDPEDLPRFDRRPSTRAIGADNDETIRILSGGQDLLVGWGVHCTPDRARGMMAALSGAKSICCLGTTMSGAPRHPLYLRKDTQRVPYVLH